MLCEVTGWGNDGPLPNERLAEAVSCAIGRMIEAVQSDFDGYYVRDFDYTGCMAEEIGTEYETED